MAIESLKDLHELEGKLSTARSKYNALIKARERIESFRKPDEAHRFRDKVFQSISMYSATSAAKNAQEMLADAFAASWHDICRQVELVLQAQAREQLNQARLIERQIDAFFYPRRRPMPAKKKSLNCPNGSIRRIGMLSWQCAGKLKSR